MGGLYMRGQDTTGAQEHNYKGKERSIVGISEHFSAHMAFPDGMRGIYWIRLEAISLTVRHFSHLSKTPRRSRV